MVFGRTCTLVSMMNLKDCMGTLLCCTVFTVRKRNMMQHVCMSTHFNSTDAAKNLKKGTLLIATAMLFYARTTHIHKGTPTGFFSLQLFLVTNILSYLPLRDCCLQI